jgi:hypothetical protein
MTKRFMDFWPDAHHSHAKVSRGWTTTQQEQRRGLISADQREALHQQHGSAGSSPSAPADKVSQAR